MTRLQRPIRSALLWALPIEAANFCLIGMMLTPDPLPPGIMPKLLADEWTFFHFLAFRTIDVAYRFLGTWDGAMIVVFSIAYLQTALIVYLFSEGIRYIRLQRPV